jgi:hypothetical protein
MSDIVERLRMLKTSAAWFCDETEATLEDAAAEIERLQAERDEALSDWRAEMDMHLDEHQCRMRAEAERNVERANAETLDAICRRTEAERDEAVATLALYRAENGCTRGQRTTQWCGEATKLRERLLQVNAGLLRVLQYEKKCDQTGKPCDASRGCACSLEAETWCDGDGA